MIIPDVNLLLYATISAFPQHDRAREWWDGAVDSGRPIGIVDPVIFGYLRIVTNARVLDPPMRIDVAIATVEGWLAQPNVTRLVGGPEHVGIAFGLLTGVGTAGNLTTDAQIAAAAIEHRGVVHSNDSDFARFAQVKYVNPLL